MDKIDGPYYFFKLIRRLRDAVPQWVPMLGRRGARRSTSSRSTSWPKAMDHIAHHEGLDGRAFHLTDPHPKSAGEVIDMFARAAHAPQFAVRMPTRQRSTLDAVLKGRAIAIAAASGEADRRPACWPTSGSRARCSSYINYPTHFDSPPGPGARSRAPDIWVPAARGLRGQAVGLLGAPPRPRPVPRPHPRGRGPRASRGRGRRHPDHRAADPRRAAAARAPGARHRLARAGRPRPGRDGHRRLVAGSARRRRCKIAEAGGIVLLVARTAEKLEETQGADRGRRRGRRTSTRATCPTSTTSTDGRGGPRPARPRRRARQQRRALDPALGRALLRPLPRLRAHDAAELLRGA